VKNHNYIHLFLRGRPYLCPGLTELLQEACDTELVWSVVDTSP